MASHIFWWILTIACVLWYTFVTVYVTIRGAADIRTMLKHLSSSTEKK
jgi:hypothetical protein